MLSIALMKDCYNELSWAFDSIYLILYMRYLFLFVIESFIFSSILNSRIFSTFQILFFSSMFIGDNEVMRCLDKGLLLFKWSNHEWKTECNFLIDVNNFKWYIELPYALIILNDFKFLWSNDLFDLIVLILRLFNIIILFIINFDIDMRCRLIYFFYKARNHSNCSLTWYLIRFILFMKILANWISLLIRWLIWF